MWQICVRHYISSIDARVSVCPVKSTLMAVQTQLVKAQLSQLQVVLYSYELDKR